MFDDRARDLLRQPVIVRISTITPQGYPHTTPVWFILDGDDLVIFTGRTTQKAKNAQRNPRGAIAIGGDPVGSPCYLIEGDLTVEPDPDHAWTAKITYHYEPPDRAQQWLELWKNDEHVILRLRARRVVKIS
jgi:PPOX class probable F420-dependent enzyme